MNSIKIYLTSLIIIILGFQKNLKAQDSIPEHQSFTIESKEMGETRTVNIWTPPDYTQNDEYLTVLYMPDGGTAEDFPHIANTIAELIASKKIKPVILVGIENTQRRRDLTPPTNVKKDKEIAPVVGESAKFRAFLQNELIPEINKRYRTTAEKGILGESLAGLFVVETLMIHPEMFDYYIAFDPSLWWNDSHLVKTARENLVKLPTENKRFWFAGSDAKDIYKNTRDLEKILKTENLSNLTWKYSDEPKEQHQTIFRATKEKAFVWVLND
ncbi:alpha/beta hydrolase [Moheibacter sediminis]|uniref:Esterase n=1 Tax=Moheibacter sediminis TaxID=1434700 RepID=A0A1W1Z6E1_9FLAO|nr:alpha/beta hydrolase-fold protein [Moheibacter sediminis]SMC43701.1 hypothetical protein SAMN06296427_102217 [Moheibacter sediminis]